MSNNAHVAQGGEIGRAQAEQAFAARQLPSVEFNPILLKPDTDTRGQVVVCGQVLDTMDAAQYFSASSVETLWNDAVLPSIKQLQGSNDVIVIEGAGSCAEVNLWNVDITNWKVAEATQADVIIVGDIDKGGIFAQLIGTYNLLPANYKKLVKGFVVNKFRGDPVLFQNGIKIIENETGVPVLGVVPMFRDIVISSEDALPLDSIVEPPVTVAQSNKIYIAVLLLPHIANLTDFQPLHYHKNVEVHYLQHPRHLHNYNAFLIPGSKNVLDDMIWIQQTGWETKIQEYAQTKNSHIGGICGGYQILCKKIVDSRTIKGLGLLNGETVMFNKKILLSRVSSTWKPFGTKVSGYEIHMGVTTHNSTSPVLATQELGHTETNPSDFGQQNESGNIWGTYIHGLFDEFEFRNKYIASVAVADNDYSSTLPCNNYAEWKDNQYELLAAHYEKHIDFSKLGL